MISRTRSSLRPLARATLLDVDPGRFRYSAWNNVSIGVWADQATLDAAERVIRVSKWMSERHPRGHSNVIFVLDGAPAPTPEANQVFAQLYDEKFTGLSCLGIVLEGSGFWASGIRSAITGLRLSTPDTVRVRVTDKPELLVDWFVCEHNALTSSNLSPRDFRSALAALREIGAHDNGETSALSTPRENRR